MAYDKALETRISSLLGPSSGLLAKKMFGGIGYLLNGNMAFGIIKEYLIVRVGADNYEAALAKPHTCVFDITGRPMKGWVMIAPEGVKNETELQNWVQAGLDFAQTLPPK